MLFLECRINVAKVIQAGDQNVYAFVSKLESSQPVLLADGKTALAVTWDCHKYGVMTTLLCSRTLSKRIWPNSCRHGEPGTT